MNITLIGMPAAGKSVIGVLLAKHLGYDFIDSDLLIQRQEGRLLWEIIRDEGPDGFKVIEEQVNASLSVTNSVIAPGGSVIYGENAMRHLSEISTIVYLKVPYEELKNRLGDLQARGVILDGGMTLHDLYEERAPYYEKYGMLEIDETGKSAAEVVREIIGELRQRRLI